MENGFRDLALHESLRNPLLRTGFGVCFVGELVGKKRKLGALLGLLLSSSFHGVSETGADLFGIGMSFIYFYLNINIISFFFRKKLHDNLI